MSVCECQDGYHGDGVVCSPINPCLSNYGGCPTNSSLCIFDGPNQHHCVCKDGYEDFQPGMGCSLIDMCQPHPPSLQCHTGAECITDAPGHPVCRCSVGHEGDGQTCYGNIIQKLYCSYSQQARVTCPEAQLPAGKRLEELNVDDTYLSGRLWFALGLFTQDSMLHRHLMDTGVYYTVFVPINSLNSSQTKLHVENGMLNGYNETARIHVVPGYMDAHLLNSTTHLYTLTGQRVIVGRHSSGITLRTEGSVEEARLLQADLPASNGVIHIIDRVLNSDSRSRQESIWNTLSANSNLHQMKWLLETFSAIDPRNRNTLESTPITVFAVTDDGLRAFFSALNREHTDASEEGQIRLGNIANMRTLDVQSSNAVIHIIDAALYANDSAYLETCVRAQDEECCEGFFSPLCIPCPGEAGVPCSGNGQCDDGKQGTGHCTCLDQFTGQECNLCSNPTMYGPHCNQTCSCLHGQCSRGDITHLGACAPDTCFSGYQGRHCDQPTAPPCSPQENQCHAHSSCVLSASGVPRCVCDAGYEASGLECLPINPCNREEYGTRGCHPFLETCVYERPGQSRCVCLYGNQTGALEDSRCHSKSSCLRDNGGCHPNATCFHSLLLDQVSCYCLPGFEGNGFSCEPINACIPNNPCDASALCVPNGPGTFDCMCPPELHRLGRRCFANLAVELEEMDGAEPFWRLIQRSHLIGYLATTNHSVGIIIPPAEAILDLENITEGALQWEPAAAYFDFDVPYWVQRIQAIRRKTDVLASTSRDVQHYLMAWSWFTKLKPPQLPPSDSDLPFTIFLPSNQALSELNSSVLMDGGEVMNHLVIGQTFYLQNLTGTDLHLTTVNNDSLQIHRHNGQTYVNMVPIAAPDILILPNGVAHGILRLLQPVERGRPSNESTPTDEITPCDGPMCCMSANHGGCSDHAICIQESRTQRSCQCVDGYYGDGIWCMDINPCLIDNGGCHPRAECMQTGVHRRGCYCDMDSVGNGLVCYSHIYEELRGIPEASTFLYLLSNLRSADMFLRRRGLYTVFVPTNYAVDTFLRQQHLSLAGLQQSCYLLTQYITYHVIGGSRFSWDDLRNRTTIGTMNGQDLRISTTTEGDVILGGVSQVTEAEIPASNGVIHLVDTMLVPPTVYDWPMEWEFGCGSHGRRPPHRRRNSSEMLDSLAASHNLTIFLQLMRQTPMLRDLFFNPSRRPMGPSGPIRGPRFPPERPVWDEDIQGVSGDFGMGDSSEEVMEDVPPRGRGVDIGILSRGPNGPPILDKRMAPPGLRLSPGWPTRRDGNYQGRNGYGSILRGNDDRGVRGQDNDDLNKKRQRRRISPHGPPRQSMHGHSPKGRPGHMDKTVFAPTDEAFDLLPPGVMEKLVAPGNQLLLQEFIAHHVLLDEIYVGTLWRVSSHFDLPTLSGLDLRLEVNSEGELLLNEKSRVIGVGMEFMGGILYPVTRVLSLPRLEGRCDRETSTIEMGRCRRCGSPMCPPNTPQVGKVERGCRYIGGWYNSMVGCHARCNFTSTRPLCCPGYYGPNCLECPGGPTHPCSNHGNCLDGMEGSGKCRCNEGYTGTACEKCSPGRYGPLCKECRCAESSICLRQTGECFCPANRTGLLCDTPLDTPPSCTPTCHQNAVCRPGNICQCLPQYHGDGYSCIVTNQCFHDNGGCSVHASCSHDASSLDATCECHDGYYGDGTVCLPVNLCMENNGGCHPNASCRFHGANSRSCWCKPPHSGNGFECHLPTASCLSNNGGCSPNAICLEGADGGFRRCQCLDGYVGDGVICNGNLFDTISSTPDFFQFSQVLAEFSDLCTNHRDLVQDLRNADDPVTVFIPRVSENGTELTFYPSQVQFHIVHDRWSREDLLTAPRLETMHGIGLRVQQIENHDHQITLRVEGVRILTFDIPATNGLIHIIEQPLPISAKMCSSETVSTPSTSNISASHIFAGIAIPIALLAFVAIVVLYWLRGKRIRELTAITTGTAMPQPPRNGSGLAAITLAPMDTLQPPCSPSSTVHQEEVRYTEFDQLMSREARQETVRNGETIM
ncbi:stabilin-2-like [Diadema setosum]|uniref:stabilin-2-like n=1 Tax=Diadema setosum TaxID=31175 RepID=UPI003B3ADCB8